MAQLNSAPWQTICNKEKKPIRYYVLGNSRLRKEKKKDVMNPGSFFVLGLFITKQLEEMISFLLFIYERTGLWLLSKSHSLAFPLSSCFQLKAS